jgi:hypothetical protein
VALQPCTKCGKPAPSGSLLCAACASNESRSAKAYEVIGEPDTGFGVLSFVHKEAPLDLTVVDHVKGVDDIHESKPSGRGDQLVFRDLPSIESPSGVQEAALH